MYKPEYQHDVSPRQYNRDIKVSTYNCNQAYKTWFILCDSPTSLLLAASPRSMVKKFYSWDILTRASGVI